MEYKKFETDKSSNLVNIAIKRFRETTNSENVLIAKTFFAAHKEVNQKYDSWDYSFHLYLSLYFGEKYFLVCPKFYIIVKYAILGHDLLEDTRLNYNGIKKLFHNFNETDVKEILEIIYAVTNEKGRNRKEKANSKYYKNIRQNDLAVYVKLCDRLANIYYSKEINSSLFSLYKKEMIHFILSLGYSKNHLYLNMFEELLHISEITFTINKLSFKQKMIYLYNTLRNFLKYNI